MYNQTITGADKMARLDVTFRLIICYRKTVLRCLLSSKCLLFESYKTNMGRDKETMP